MRDVACTACGKVPEPPDYVIAGLCGACNDAYCAATEPDATEFDGPDIRQTRRDELAASDRFTDALTTMNYRIASVTM